MEATFYTLARRLGRFVEFEKGLIGFFKCKVCYLTTEKIQKVWMQSYIHSLRN
jgi:hypothetical protein